MFSKEQKILVTGGTGMVGSHLIKELTQKGYSVRATYRSKHQECKEVEWVQADILDVVALEDAFVAIDVVIHCAAQVSFDPSNASSLLKNNVEGTANVVNAAIDAEVKKFIYVSSVAAIGAAADQMITEDSPWARNEIHNDYAETKHAAEMEVRRGELEGLNVFIVNPSIILGCGDWNSGSTELFKKIYHRFPYYTEGIHGFVDVMDVVTILIAFLEDQNNHLQGERFILNGKNITYKELFDLIADGFPVPKPTKKVTPFLAGIVWRLSYLKGKITRKPSMLTKNSARIAQSDIQYDNKKILAAFPDFNFQPIEKTVKRICDELKKKYQLH